ncbi:hypothetical protein [Hirschia litorea]|uniref:Uncharacterized protein n=1 Tax=Hirschia litorea TaxID=1199156 RepID=A0ABW2IKN6_9PROT
MSFGSETPDFERRADSASAKPCTTGFFNPRTGLYHPSKSNVVKFRSRHSVDPDRQMQIDSADKWPLLLSLSFAFGASALLWAGIALAAKALF